MQWLKELSRKSLLSCVVSVLDGTTTTAFFSWDPRVFSTVITLSVYFLLFGKPRISVFEMKDRRNRLGAS